MWGVGLGCCYWVVCGGGVWTELRPPLVLWSDAICWQTTGIERRGPVDMGGCAVGRHIGRMGAEGIEGRARLSMESGVIGRREI